MITVLHSFKCLLNTSSVSTVLDARDSSFLSVPVYTDDVETAFVRVTVNLYVAKSNDQFLIFFNGYSSIAFDAIT